MANLMLLVGQLPDTEYIYILVFWQQNHCYKIGKVLMSRLWKLAGGVEQYRPSFWGSALDAVEQPTSHSDRYSPGNQSIWSWVEPRAFLHDSAKSKISCTWSKLCEPKLSPSVLTIFHLKGRTDQPSVRQSARSVRHCIKSAHSCISDLAMY
jgi:hypothetical protein